MSEPVGTLKIAIWCLPGEYKRTQVKRLPDLINGFDAKHVSVQAKVQMAETMDVTKRADFSGDPDPRYLMIVERFLKRKSQRPSKRLRYLVNHQYHLLQIDVFDDMEALHMPDRSTSSMYSADLLIIVLDENAVDWSVSRTQTTPKAISSGSEEPGMAYLRKRVKTTEHYLKYQEMRKHTESSLLKMEESKKYKISIDDYRASVIRVLNIVRSFNKNVAVLKVGEIKDEQLNETLLSYFKETKNDDEKKSDLSIRFYKDVAEIYGRIKEQHSEDSIKTIEIEGFMELLLSELAEIEKKRIRRKKFVRWFFGNDTVKLYRSYEKQRKKSKKHVTVY